MKQKKVELAWVKNEACDPKHLGDLCSRLCHAAARMRGRRASPAAAARRGTQVAARTTAMVKLNLRLRGGGGDGGVYPLTHAEQKVRPSAVSG